MKIGNLDISAFKVGGANCSIYLGDVKLYPEDVPPTPPSFDGKYKFTLSDDSVVSGECDSSSELTKSEVSAYKTTLKEAVVGDCVTSIGNSAFRDCSGLTSCTIGSGVTSIGEYAFYGCMGLTSIEIPSGVTTIGNGAFQNTNLHEVIMNNVVTIGNLAFDRCQSTSFHNVNLPATLTNMGVQAFSNCIYLREVVCYATTPPIMDSAFYNCHSSLAIYVPASSVDTYKSASGWKDYASRIQAIPNS